MSGESFAEFRRVSVLEFCYGREREGEGEEREREREREREKERERDRERGRGKVSMSFCWGLLPGRARHNFKLTGWLGGLGFRGCAVYIL